MENFKNYTTLINGLSNLFQKKRTMVRGHITLYSTLHTNLQTMCQRKNQNIKKNLSLQLFSLVLLNSRKLTKAYYNIHSKKFIQDKNLFHFAFTKFPQPISNQVKASLSLTLCHVQYACLYAICCRNVYSPFEMCL